MRALKVVAACLATASACRAPLPVPNEAELRRAARSVVHEATFTLSSPYDDATTADYAASVRDEIGLVRRLFRDDGTKPVRIYLAPIEDDSGRALQFWQTPSHRSLKGAATEGEFAFVYVPRSVEPSAALASALSLRGGTLRHELAHLYAARAGLAQATWFNEGLAEEVESMNESGSELVQNPFPATLLLARKTAGPDTLRRLLAWRLGDDLSDVDRSCRYVWAHALLRFLGEARSDPGFEARTRAVMELDPEAIVAQEPEWLAWLAALDALARIRTGAHSPSARERALSIGVMPSLAENGAPELFTRAADELALEMLADPACMEPAARFLLFFRAREVKVEDLEQLNRSTDPAAILTAQALHAARKEPVDLERARSAWQQVAPDDRLRFIVIESLLPGMSKPRS